jgi:hypothetical protein
MIVGKPVLAILLFLAAFVGKLLGVFVMVPMGKISVRELGIIAICISIIGALTGWVILAWIFTIGLQVRAIYLPFLQQALHTVPLGFADGALLFYKSHSPFF